MHLESDLNELNLAKIDYIHFDLMDGNFVPRYGLFPEYLEDIKFLTEYPIEVHLMAYNPEDYLPLLVESGAHIITPHIEALVHPHRTITEIQKLSALPGLALNISTPLCVLDHVLEELHLVTLMAINPGIKGHGLIEQIFKKIESLRQIIDQKGLRTLIQIDGGVDFKTAKRMIEAGADILVCGTGTIFRKEESISKQLETLRQVIGD